VEALLRPTRQPGPWDAGLGSSRSISPRQTYSTGRLGEPSLPVIPFRTSGTLVPSLIRTSFGLTMRPPASSGPKTRAEAGGACFGHLMQHNERMTEEVDSHRGNQVHHVRAGFPGALLAVLGGALAVLWPLRLLAGPGEPILLWDGVAPGEQGDIPAEKVVRGGKDGIERTSNVTTPTMTLYPAPAAKRTGAAVLVCPGGGYSILASEHEGTAVCRWLNDIGVTAVLLNYRVPRREGLAKHHAPLQDAQRAMGMIRSRAAEWHIDPKRIGVLGFSAGGHLAAMALSHPGRTFPADPKRDAASCRPDFGILIYPAYLLDGDDPAKLAPELQFTADSQPVFIAVASDDKWASSSARLYLELQRLKVPVEMHAFAHGGHGFGILKKKDLPVGSWPELCADWLKASRLDQSAP
jgi:acetyl esterase/lipase